MTKKQLREYEVIESSKESKEYWNKHELGSKHFELLGTFLNEFSELFVIYHEKDSLMIYITGDEFGWECTWRIDPATLRITKDFYINHDELKEAHHIMRSLRLSKKSRE